MQAGTNVQWELQGITPDGATRLYFWFLLIASVWIFGTLLSFSYRCAGSRRRFGKQYETLWALISANKYTEVATKANLIPAGSIDVPLKDLTALHAESVLLDLRSLISNIDIKLQYFFAVFRSWLGNLRRGLGLIVIVTMFWLVEQIGTLYKVTELSKASSSSILGLGFVEISRWLLVSLIFLVVDYFSYWVISSKLDRLQRDWSYLVARIAKLKD